MKTHCKNGHPFNEKRKCPTCLKEAHKRWKSAHPDREKEVRRNHYNKHKERSRKLSREKRFLLKIEVLTQYSPNKVLGCCWMDCNIHDVDMLSLDHIENNGAKERREQYGDNKGFSGGSTRVYSRVKREGFPEGFQTLCMNHQWKKEIERLRSLWDGS
jgi:hypothetical protein